VEAAGRATRVLAGRYELHRRLGSGGAGTVWRGYDRALDRPVAIKLLHADLAEDPAAEHRFRTEATAAAKLTHPNAVLVYDLGRDGIDDYLVMELVQGSSLASVLGEGPLPAGVAAAVGAQVAGALGTAHHHGIVHRDVKPGNVLLTSEGYAKLADFGIARALGAITSRLTRTGTVLGTARYLAPEQLRDDPIDARADVYALGLVLHETLTGRAPFGEGSAVEVASRRLTTSLPAVGDVVDGVPSGLEEIVTWATRLDPGERPEDGARMADALRRFVAHDAAGALARRVAAVPVRTTDPAPSPPSRSEDLDTGPLRATPPPTRDEQEDDGATRALPTSRPAAARVPAVATGRSAAASAATASTARGDATSALETAPPPAAPTDTEGRPRRTKRWLLVVAALAALALVGYGLSTLGGGDDAPVATDDGDASEPDDDAADPDEALPIAGGGDHDPLGDRQERGEDVPRAFDDDRDSFWPSETYSSADLGNLKDGVGMWVELEEPAALDRVEVLLSSEGGTLELWVGDDPPADDDVPDDWGTLVGRGEIPESEIRFPDLPEAAEGRTVLLWFTEVPSSSSGGGYRAEIRDVRLFPR
jgi:eukaryotic-like serine/threonine-protein kinase